METRTRVYVSVTLHSPRQAGNWHVNYTVSQKKTRHLIIYQNFGKCESIFKILSPPYS